MAVAAIGKSKGHLNISEQNALKALGPSQKTHLKSSRESGAAAPHLLLVPTTKVLAVLRPGLSAAPAGVPAVLGHTGDGAQLSAETMGL